MAVPRDFRATAPAVGANTMARPHYHSLSEDKHRIDVELQSIIATCRPNVTPRFFECLERAVLSGGRRIRPILALRVARYLQAETSYTPRLGAALELVHAASLVLDDLPCMDDSRQRRGADSIQVAFGESTAVLCAIALLALSLRSLVDPALQPTEMPQLRSFQVQLLQAIDSDGLIAGQYADLVAQRRLAQSNESNTSHRDLLRISEQKTGVLFVAAIQAGSAFAHLSSAEYGALLQFGRSVGIYFQLADDASDGEKKWAAGLSGPSPSSLLEQLACFQRPTDLLDELLQQI